MQATSNNGDSISDRPPSSTCNKNIIACNNNNNNNRMAISNFQTQIKLQELPQYLHRKTARKGFELTLMVVGIAGVGKSTLINSLFAYDIRRDCRILPVDQLLHRTVSIDRHCLQIQEKGVKLNLTLIDTPGYGDALNCEDSFIAVESYVDYQFKRYLKDECSFDRKNIQDHRVHCCLYMISPFGWSLTQLDKNVMLRLHKKVNLVPCIAKADALTKSELAAFRQRVMQDIEDLGIQIYKLPEVDSDEESAIKQENQDIRDAIPFAIVSTNATVEVNGHAVRGRLYPWGVCNINDPSCSDFTRLRSFLSIHMQDLKDYTNEVLYENYRSSFLVKMTQDGRYDCALDAGPNSSSHAIAGIALTDQISRDLLQQKEEQLRQTEAKLLMVQEQLQALSSVPVSENPSDDEISLHKFRRHHQNNSLGREEQV